MKYCHGIFRVLYNSLQTTLQTVCFERKQVNLVSVYDGNY